MHLLHLAIQLIDQWGKTFFSNIIWFLHCVYFSHNERCYLIWTLFSRKLQFLIHINKSILSHGHFDSYIGTLSHFNSCDNLSTFCVVIFQCAFTDVGYTRNFQLKKIYILVRLIRWDCTRIVNSFTVVLCIKMITNYCLILITKIWASIVLIFYHYNKLFPLLSYKNGNHKSKVTFNMWKAWI